MFFSGLSFEKLLLLGVIAAIVIGPERLPKYAQSLAQLVKRARTFATDAKTRVREEMGPEFDDVDWRTLDPRQYDPRRIIREALLDDAPVAAPVALATRTAIAEAPDSERPATFRVGDVPPFDNEAT